MQSEGVIKQSFQFQSSCKQSTQVLAIYPNRWAACTWARAISTGKQNHSDNIFGWLHAGRYHRHEDVPPPDHGMRRKIWHPNPLPISPERSCRGSGGGCERRPDRWQGGGFGGVGSLLSRPLGSLGGRRKRISCHICRPFVIRNFVHVLYKAQTIRTGTGRVTVPKFLLCI